jgi:hypothetical protein
MTFVIVLNIKLSSKHEFCENQLSDTFATNFSCIVSKGGCSCIFARNDKALSSNAVFQFGVEKTLEPCAIRINLGLYNIIAICVCRSPSGSFNQFLHVLDLKLLHVYKPRSEFIFCEDINVKVLMDSNKKMKVSSL